MSGIRLKHNGWVVVADGEKALFLRNEGTPDTPHLQVFKELEQDNPSTSEQGVARPGRLSDGMGAKSRSAVQETDWHRLAKHDFARLIAAQLAKAALADRFDQLVVVAPPVVLGEMRKEYNANVSAKVIAEVNKDMTKHPINEIEKLLF